MWNDLSVYVVGDIESFKQVKRQFDCRLSMECDTGMAVTAIFGLLSAFH